MWITMNCQTIQNKILNLPDPRVIPDVLRDHVAGCADCRVWAKQAARLESLLEQLPVPPAPGNKKAEMLEDLTSNDPVITRPFATPARESSSASFWKFLDQNKMVLGGLAAAVLVAFGGWLLFNRPGTPVVAAAETPRNPFLEKIVQRDLALSKAK